jgi:hypothetical protein
MLARSGSTPVSPVPPHGGNLWLQVNSQNFKRDVFSKLTSGVRVKQRFLSFVSSPKLVPSPRSSWRRHLDPEWNVLAHLVAGRTVQRGQGRATEAFAALNAVPRSDDSAIVDALAVTPTQVQDALFLRNVQYRF